MPARLFVGLDTDSVRGSLDEVVAISGRLNDVSAGSADCGLDRIPQSAAPERRMATEPYGVYRAV